MGDVRGGGTGDVGGWVLVVIDGLGRASTRLVDEVGVGEIMLPGVSFLLCCWSREGGGMGINTIFYCAALLVALLPPPPCWDAAAPADDRRSLDECMDRNK